MGAGRPGEGDGDLGQFAGRARHPFHDPLLGGAVLVTEGDAAHAVVDRLADAGRPDGIERVHGGDQPELRRGGDMSDAGHVEFALGEGGDEDVEGLLGHPVEFLDVEQAPLPQGGDEGPFGEGLGQVAPFQHQGRIVGADEAGRGELGVALDELHPPAGGVGDDPQQRRLSHTGRAFKDDVATGSQRCHKDLGRPAQADDALLDAFEEDGRREPRRNRRGSRADALVVQAVVQGRRLNGRGR